MEQEIEQKVNHVLEMYQKHGRDPVTIDIYCQHLKVNRKITISYINSKRSFEESFCLDPSAAHDCVRTICKGYIALTPKINTLIYQGEEGKEHEYQLEQINSKGQLVSQLCIHNMALYHIRNLGKKEVLKQPNGIYASWREYQKVYDETNLENQRILNYFPNNDGYRNRIFEFYHNFSLIELQQYAFLLFQTCLEQQKGEPLTLEEMEELQTMIVLKYNHADKVSLINQILNSIDPSMITPGMTNAIKKQFVKKQQQG